MGKIKIAKRVSFLVTENIKIENDKLFQTFQFYTNNKKYLKYAFDQRFCLKRKLEKLYNNELLNLTFLNREEHEDKVVFVYEYNKEKIGFSSKTVNCDFYLPPYNGCKYCSNKEIKGDFLYCLIKKKHYDSSGIKNCPVFQSIEEVIS